MRRLSLKTRLVLFHTGLIAPKTTKNTQGVQAMNLKKGQRLMSVRLYEEGMLQNPNRYKKNLPALGALPEAGESVGGQLELSGS